MNTRILYRPELGFKTMIIIIFILTLTQVNGQPHSWTRPCPKLTFESRFKTMIIIIYFYAELDQSDLWPRPRSMTRLYLVSTFELSFKTIKIIICIPTCLSWTIFKLKFVYNDILGIKIRNIVFKDMSPLYILFLKYKNSL